MTARPHARPPDSLLAVLAELPLPKDDTEESIPGSDLHQAAVMEAFAVLKDYAAEAGGGGGPAWYVSSQALVTVGLPPHGRAVWRHRPDLFVVPGADAGPRAAYDTRKDGPMPPFVLEVTGESTRHNDVAVKQRWYDVLGVQEYLVFDPTGEHLGVAMRGWHLTADGWAAWEPVRRGDGTPVWASVVLGLAVRPEGTLVRFDHPRWGPLPLRRDLKAQLAELARRVAELERAPAEERRPRAALEDEPRAQGG